MFQKIIRNALALLRNTWLYLVLVIAAMALFYLAFSLSRANVFALMAAGVAFGCLVALFLAARRHPIQPDKAEETKTTLLTPTILLNEAWAAALVSYGQIGTVTIKKERSKATSDTNIAAPMLNKVFGEALTMDVGVRIVAGVNLKHLQEKDIRINGKSVEIKLPPTKVLMVYVDESLTRVVEHKSGWLTGRDITLMDAARREAMESMVNAAVGKDLFEKAGQQAALTVASMARGLGFDSVQVIPTLPPIGQHYEELQDPSQIAKIIALPTPIQPREDQHE